jgi:inner membrane protein
MDSLTQIVLGGAAGEAVLGKRAGNKAVMWGAIAGTVPDLDVFVKFFTDALTADELHRGFSHSLLFSLLFAPVLGWIAFKIHQASGIGWRSWSKLMFAALVTHPLLDIHTAWGTQFLWPLETKFTYNNIFVVDPLYTLPFMAFLILAMCRKKDDPYRRKLNNMGIYISCAYMVLTLGFKAAAHHHFSESLGKQGITYLELEAKPTPLNSLLWCGFVKRENEILLGYYSILDKPGTIQFTSFPQHKEFLGDLAENDVVHRMDKLARGWYVIEKDSSHLYFDDIRFGQQGFGDDPSSIVFSREITADNGEVSTRMRPRSFEGAGKDMKLLFRRMVGN